MQYVRGFIGEAVEIQDRNPGNPGQKSRTDGNPGKSRTDETTPETPAAFDDVG
jgi:hypothetical protein